MALLGWSVSLYPGYLCDWFGTDKAFTYGSSSVTSLCQQLRTINDLTQAEQNIFAIQAALAQDVPFIPLYSTIAYDSRAKVNYPFDEVWGGLSQVYGAPNLAFPAAP